MKTGRNEPCPCGSGRKYKQCCLRKEQDERHAQQKAEHPLGEAPDSAPEPGFASPGADVSAEAAPEAQYNAFDARWDAFEAADYDGKIALFTQTVHERELMDSDMAFEMLNCFYDECVQQQQRHRFAEWVNVLRAGSPEAYAQNAAYLLGWQIDNVLATGAYSRLPALVRELSAEAGSQPDLFQILLDKLAYHGQLALLRQAMQYGWPQLKTATGLVPWALDDFASQAVEFTLLAHIERYPEGDGSEDELKQGLSEYVDTTELDWARLIRYLALVTGRDQRSWADDDFVPSRDASAQHRHELGAVFLGYLQRVERVSLSKGELARTTLLRYLSERYGQHKPSSKHRKAKAPLTLCPDRASLDTFLARRLDLLSSEYYRAISLFELIPAWLRFLQTVNLADSALAENTLRQLRSLREPLLAMCPHRFGDPALERALEAWPSTPPQ